MVFIFFKQWSSVLLSLPGADRDGVAIGFFRQQIDLHFDLRQFTVRVHDVTAQNRHHH